MIDTSTPQKETPGKKVKKQCATTDYNLRHTSILGSADEVVKGRVRLHSFIHSDINS